MAEMMMQLGQFQFSLDTAAFQELRRSVEYRWASMQRIDHRPSLQFVGVGAETIDLRGTIYPHFRGGLEQIETLRGYAVNGKPQTLVSGYQINGNNNLGPWCVLGIEEEHREISFKGAPLKIEFSMRIGYFGPDDEKTGTRGYVKQVQTVSSTVLGKLGATAFAPIDLPENLPRAVPPITASMLNALSPALQAAKIPPQQAASTLTTAVQRVQLLSKDATSTAAILSAVGLTVSGLQRGVTHDPVGTLSRLLTGGITQAGIKALFGADLAGPLFQIGAATQVGQRSVQTVGQYIATTSRTVVH